MNLIPLIFPKGFVDALYQDVLNRTASAAEENGWISVLNGGASLASVAAGFLTSPGTEKGTQLFVKAAA